MSDDRHDASACHLCGRWLPPEEDCSGALVFCSPQCYGRWFADLARAAALRGDA